MGAAVVTTCFKDGRRVATYEGEVTPKEREEIAAMFTGSIISWVEDYSIAESPSAASVGKSDAA